MDNSVIVSYIKSSIEILLSLKAQGTDSTEKKGIMQSQSNSSPDFTPNTDKNSRLDSEGNDPMLEYERMVQKLEADVRNHIRIEQQLKLHIETIQSKLEDYEKGKG